MMSLEALADRAHQSGSDLRLVATRIFLPTWRPCCLISKPIYSLGCRFQVGGTYAAVISTDETLAALESWQGFPKKSTQPELVHNIPRTIFYEFVVALPLSRVPKDCLFGPSGRDVNHHTRRSEDPHQSWV